MMNHLPFKMIASQAAACLLAGLCVAGAQKNNTAQRISFLRGQTSTVVRGKLSPQTNDIYRLSARSGQRMTVHLQSPKGNVVFWLQSKNYFPERSTYLLEGIDRGGDTDWMGALPFSGEYEIYVSNPRISDHSINATLSYTLKVEIR